MTWYRSSIIGLAQDDIPQGSVDTQWSIATWDRFFCEAIDALHDAVVSADLDYFLVRGATLTKNSGDTYDLPTDFHAMIRVRDTEGEAINRLTRADEDSGLVIGWVLTADVLQLLNWEGDYPATLICDYRKRPKEMAVWDGTDDSVKATPAQYEPDSPFDKRQAVNVLARMISYLASCKDEAATTEQASVLKNFADGFVDRFMSRSDDR